ncbi:hypothetical protein HOY82DRAFT_604252 [Tuber indicum]|nr:hypothetical protein HOY82DRAFT_604252 [Tuber indicum]
MSYDKLSPWFSNAESLDSLFSELDHDNPSHRSVDAVISKASDTALINKQHLGEVSSQDSQHAETIIKNTTLTPPPTLPSTTTGSQNNPTLIDDENNIPSSFPSRKVKARKLLARAVDWSAEMTTVLVRELVASIRTGKRSDNGFKMEVWNAVSDAVRLVAAGDALLTGDKCQAKLEVLKRKWKLWTRLKNMSGFGFNPLTGTITAPDKVWEMEIQQQPGIREFRDTPLANLDELGEIFEGVLATGHHAIYPQLSSSYSNNINSSSANTTPSNTEYTTPPSSSSQHKRTREEDESPLTPLGRVRQRLDTPAT